MSDTKNSEYDNERKLLTRMEENGKEQILYFIKDFKVPSTSYAFCNFLLNCNNIINILPISVKKFRMKILEIIIDIINRYSKLRDFSLSFVLS